MSNDPAFYIDEASTFGSTMLSFYGGKKRITEKINNYKNIKSTSFKNVLFKSKSEADSCNNLILSDIEIVRKEIVDLIILNSAYLINSFNNFEIEIDDIIDDIYTSKNLREFNIYIANMIDYNKNSMN